MQQWYVLNAELGKSFAFVFILAATFNPHEFVFTTQMLGVSSDITSV